MQASTIRFNAAHLFYALSLSAAATSVFGGLGLPIALFVCVIWWQVLSGARREAAITSELGRTRPNAAQPESNSPAIRPGAARLEFIAAFMAVALIVGLIIPARDDADPMRQAENSMRVVAKAVHNYERTHGARLPCVLCDADGRPAHSWRALILAELGEEQLAAAYRFDEPWDGPNNIRLLAYRPWHYRTFYPGCRLPAGQTTLRAVPLDGEFMIIEHEGQAVPWLQPDEFTTSDWNSLNKVPPVGDGFWRQGFFASSYRGRLAVGTHGVYEMQPGSRFADIHPALDDGSEERRRIGSTHVQLHLAAAFRLACFLLVALYPIRWLNRIRRPG